MEQELSPSAGLEEEFQPRGAEEALKQVELLKMALEERFRYRSNWAFQDGAVVDLRSLPADVEILLVGDLHAQLGNLESILGDRDESGSSVLEKLAEGRAVLVFPGDAFHREGRWEMDSSVATAQRIMDLMIGHPSSVYFLLGNHDPLTGDVTLTTGRSAHGTRSVWHPGLRLRERMVKLYGEPYVARFEEVFLANHALMAIGKDLLALHAGPVQEAVSLEEIKRLNVLDARNPIVRQVTWSRFQEQSDRAPFFTRGHAEDFRKGMGQPDALLFLGHSHRRELPWHWSPRAPESVPYMHFLYAGRNRPRGGYAVVRDNQVRFRVPGEPSGAGLEETIAAAEGLRWMVIGASVAGRFPALAELAGLEEHFLVDEGADTVVRLAERDVRSVAYYGGLEEAGAFASLAAQALIAVEPHSPSAPAFLAQLREILILAGIPQDVLAAGMEEFAAELESLAVGA